MPFSSLVIEISDSDDARPLPPSSSQFSGKSVNTDVVDLCSSDDELPAPGEPKFFRSVAQGKRKRGSISAASSRSPSVGYPAYLGESSDEEESPRKIARKKSSASTGKAQRKPRKTEEEKAAAKELKQQVAAQKKAEKAADKAAKAAEMAAEKESKKAYKAANKLVNDKKLTLKDMELVFPPALKDSPLFPAFCDHVAQFSMEVSVSDRNILRGYDVLSWQRTMTKEYDSEAREWFTVEPHVKIENTYLVYMTADILARCIRDEDGVKNVVRQVRKAVVADGRPQIFLMIFGLTAYLRSTGGIRVSIPPFFLFLLCNAYYYAQYTKGEIERALAALQMAEHAHLLYVDTVEAAVAQLYDLSADLGIKPYKLIERSHLPFCANTHQPPGTSLRDTWEKMLEQVHRVTHAGALGIAEVFPTANSLFEGYAEARDARARDLLVMNCTVGHRADGAASPRPIGQALSQVVGTVMYGTDPLQLANKAN
ncbi:hypothetical protein C8R44DRAFT_730487 [Mycena epipterygia]|nr:hypothetical protein C8R44DRAFT_730487 [Mycena epipterygia]